MKTTAEHQRLDKYRRRRANWKKWGPYLSERSWDTVREDYSADSLLFTHNETNFARFGHSSNGKP